MLYKITAVSEKNPDWKIVSGMGADGSPLIDASVNRKSTKGDIFPRFDETVVGAQIEGEPWTSGAGKLYLFGPRPQKAYSGAAKKADIREAQAVKAEYIREAQDRKEESIAFFNATNSALTIISGDIKSGLITVDTAQEKIRYWRDWFLAEYEKYKGRAPF